jgi:hypothetical protein
MPTIGANNWSIALIAASWPFMPCSILWAAPSTTTMASSTTDANREHDGEQGRT